MLTNDIKKYESCENDLLYWLILSQHFPALPLHKISNLLENFSSLKTIWNLNDKELYKFGFGHKDINDIKKLNIDKALDEQKRNLNEIKHKNIKILKYIDIDYPLNLKKSVTNPPILLFYKGVDLKLDNCAAIVGTRDCSFYGRNTVRNLAKNLADKDIIITSGLARGVDIEAHCGALSSKNGKTIGVLAWIDPIYPHEHTELANDIYKRGGCLSENLHKSMGAADYRKFVDRNRIISELSHFIIIGETGEDGGTIRQAEWAKKQNKPVFILRPKEDNLRANRGFNKITESYGGIPFNNEDDLLDILPEILQEHKSEKTDNSQLKIDITYS